MNDKEALIAVHTVCVKLITELARTVTFAADTLEQNKVDSYILMEIIATTALKLKEIRDESDTLRIRRGN